MYLTQVAHPKGNCSEYGYSESKNVPRQLDSDHLKSSDSKLSQSGIGP